MSESQTERWADVRGHHGYMVSSDGRVKSMRRVVRSGNPSGSRTVQERILNAWVCKQTGYIQVCLNRQKVNVHSIVLEAFVSERPQGLVCAHGDNNRTNASLSNLRWATYSENATDRIGHGTHLRGEKNHQSKLRAEDILAIRADTRTRSAIAKTYGVTPEAISHIVLRKNWAWVA